MITQYLDQWCPGIYRRHGFRILSKTLELRFNKHVSSFGSFRRLWHD